MPRCYALRLKCNDDYPRWFLDSKISELRDIYKSFCKWGFDARRGVGWFTEPSYPDTQIILYEIDFNKQITPLGKSFRGMHDLPNLDSVPESVKRCTNTKCNMFYDHNLPSCEGCAQLIFNLPKSQQEREKSTYDYFLEMLELLTDKNYDAMSKLSELEINNYHDALKHLLSIECINHWLDIILKDFMETGQEEMIRYLFDIIPEKITKIKNNYYYIYGFQKLIKSGNHNLVFFLIINDLHPKYDKLDPEPRNLLLKMYENNLLKKC